MFANWKIILSLGILVFFSLAVGDASSAQACQKEAQVIGEVTHVVSDGQSCWVFADYSFYQASQVCPLDSDYVKTYGVSIPGANCPFRPGHTLSGVLYQVGPDVLLER